MQKQQLASLRVAVAEAMADKEATFEALGTAREKALELQEALADANAQVRLLTAELAAVRSELDAGLTNDGIGEGVAQEEGMAEQLAELQKELDEARSKAAAAQQARDETDASLATLQHDLDGAHADIVAAQTARVEADALVAKLQTDLDDARADAATARHAREQCNRAVAELKLEVEDAHAEVVEARQAREKGDEAFAKLQLDLDAARDGLKEAELEVRTVKAQAEAGPDACLLNLEKDLASKNAEAHNAASPDAAALQVAVMQEEVATLRKQTSEAFVSSGVDASVVGREHKVESINQEGAEAEETAEAKLVEDKRPPSISHKESAAAHEMTSSTAVLQVLQKALQEAEIRRSALNSEGAVAEELFVIVREALARCAAEAAASEGELQEKIDKLAGNLAGERVEFSGREALLLSEIKRLRAGLAAGAVQAAMLAEKTCNRATGRVGTVAAPVEHQTASVLPHPVATASAQEIEILVQRVEDFADESVAAREQQALSMAEVAQRAEKALRMVRGADVQVDAAYQREATGAVGHASMWPGVDRAQTEQEVLLLRGEVERLQAAEGQTVDELTRCAAGYRTTANVSYTVYIQTPLFQRVLGLYT
jgi:hypothetical protein